MPTQRKTRSGKRKWFGRVNLPNGKRVEKQFDTKKEATEWEVLARSRVIDSRKTDTDSLTMAALVEQYLDMVKARYSTNMYYQKKRTFKLLFRDVDPTRKVTSVKYAEIEAHLNGIAHRVSGYRANKNRQQIISAYQWGMKAYGLPGPCPWMVERYKEKRTPRYIPPEEDFWKVYEVAEPVEKRMLITYLHTAARMREVFYLRWEDVDFKEGRVRLWTNKRKGGREYDWVPMTGELVTTLKEQQKLTGGKEYVYINPQTDLEYRWRGKMMPSLCRKAGVKPFGFHGIRHLSASMIDAAGKPLAMIQSILRHKSADTTAKYLHTVRGVKADLNDVFSSPRGRRGKSSGRGKRKVVPKPLPRKSIRRKR